MHSRFRFKEDDSRLVLDRARTTSFESYRDKPRLGTVFQIAIVITVEISNTRFDQNGNAENTRG